MANDLKISQYSSAIVHALTELLEIVLNGVCGVYTA